MVNPDKSVDLVCDDNYRGALFAEMGSTTVKRYSIYRGDVVEFSVNFLVRHVSSLKR